MMLHQTPQTHQSSQPLQLGKQVQTLILINNIWYKYDVIIPESDFASSSTGAYDVKITSSRRSLWHHPIYFQRVTDIFKVQREQIFNAPHKGPSNTHARH